MNINIIYYLIKEKFFRNMIDDIYYNLNQGKKKSYTNHQHLDSLKSTNISSRQIKYL